ncbi:MAG TPA: MFS transporter [Solirubrobacterales bacterium]|nr:MFS transporter [Solirubrobacterales bacterium]
MSSSTGTPRLGILLAMAMFVFVIDTSLMNVSISAVVRDLDTTVSGVQSAIALEALVSAAFILIGSKLGDLFGRKRAYVSGLILYALGALAMVFAQGLAAIIVFWAVIGGLGASLYLPAMQSLIHGNFEGRMQAKVYALLGASAAIAAAVGPLIGGFLTTLLSWRVGFMLEAVIIAGVLLGSGLIREVPYTGDRSVDVVGSALSVLGMSLLVLGVLAWQEGGESVAALLVAGAAFSVALVRWLIRRKREGKPTLFDPDLFTSKLFSFGITQSILQQIALGGLLIALPIYLQLDLGYNALQAGVSLAPLSLTMFFISLLAGRRAGKRRPSSLIRAGFALLGLGVLAMIPIVPRADTSLYLVIPLLLCGAGLGLLVSQLNNYTLAPISEERVGEAAGVNSAISSFGLSVGLAFAGAILLAALSISFTNKSDASDVLAPAQKEHVAQVLEDDAEVMSDARLKQQLAGQPPEIQEEILRINDDARPEALQVALLVPLLTAIAGLFFSFRMMRLPDPAPSEAAEAASLG